MVHRRYTRRHIRSYKHTMERMIATYTNTAGPSALHVLISIWPYLALAGANNGSEDELAVIAVSGIWPVCIPRDALQPSATISDVFSVHVFDAHVIAITHRRRWYVHDIVRPTCATASLATTEQKHFTKLERRQKRQTIQSASRKTNEHYNHYSYNYYCNERKQKIALISRRPLGTVLPENPINDFTVRQRKDARKASGA